MYTHTFTKLLTSFVSLTKKSKEQMTVVYYIFFEHPQSNASSVSLCTELGGMANKAAVARNAKELERKHKQIL